MNDETVNEITGFERALQALPQCRPPQHCWRQIESQLGGDQRRWYQRPGISAPLAVAASLLLAVTFYWPVNVELNDAPQSFAAVAQQEARYSEAAAYYPAQPADYQAALQARVNQLNKAMEYASPDEQLALWAYREELQAGYTRASYQPEQQTYW